MSLIPWSQYTFLLAIQVVRGGFTPIVSIFFGQGYVLLGLFIWAGGCLFFLLWCFIVIDRRRLARFTNPIGNNPMWLYSGIRW